MLLWSVQFRTMINNSSNNGLSPDRRQDITEPIRTNCNWTPSNKLQWNIYQITESSVRKMRWKMSPAKCFSFRSDPKFINHKTSASLSILSSYNIFSSYLCVLLMVSLGKINRPTDRHLPQIKHNYSQSRSFKLGKYFRVFMAYQHIMVMMFLERAVFPSEFRFYWHVATLIPVWLSNHIHSKVWDEVTYPFPKFNVRECISNFTL